MEDHSTKNQKLFDQECNFKTKSAIIGLISVFSQGGPLLKVPMGGGNLFYLVSGWFKVYLLVVSFWGVVV